MGGTKEREERPEKKFVCRCQGYSPVKIGLLSLDVDGVDGIEAEPGSEGPPSLVGPPRQGGQH